MVLSDQGLHLGIQDLTDSDGSLSMTEQGETIGIVIDRDLDMTDLGEMIGIVIDRGQLQDFQGKHLFLGALGVGVIRVTKLSRTARILRKCWRN